MVAVKFTVRFMPVTCGYRLTGFKATSKATRNFPTSTRAFVLFVYLPIANGGKIKK